MKIIDNFDEYIEKINLELENINQSYYSTFLIGYFEGLMEKWKDFEIDQDDKSEEVTEALDEGLQTINYILADLEAEETSYQDFETLRKLKTIFLDLCKELELDINQLEEGSSANNIEEDGINNILLPENEMLLENEKKQESPPVESNNNKENTDSSDINEEFNDMQKEINSSTVSDIEEPVPPKISNINSFENLSENEKMREIFYRATENYNNILDKIENLNLEVTPDALTELTKNFEKLEFSLSEQYKNLDDNLKTFISSQIEDIKEKTENQLKEAIENNKIQTELDKKSKGFLALGGLSSILFSLFVLVQIFLGITYYQGYIKYQNLMNVFDNMPVSQRQQMSEWIANSYQNLNTKGNKSEQINRNNE